MKSGINRPIWFLQLWEKNSTVVWILSILWLSLLGWLAFIWNLGSTGLIDETEPLFAEAARQMTVTGDWVTPYFNEETRFDKPPLIYWLMAIAYKLVGVNSWGARLPSALAAIALMALGFYVLKQFGVARPALAQSVDPAIPGTTTRSDRPVDLAQANHQRWLSAWIGAALMALNPQTIAWARTGVSDMLLSGCMGGALLAFFCGYAQCDKPKVQDRWYLAFYVLTSLAVLTKGPVGVVIPGLVIVAFLFYMGNLRTVLREMKLVRGGVLFLVLSVPWYVLVIQANGWNFINSFFGYHNLERFTQVVNNHSAPWYFYFLVVLIGFMPWSIYLPMAIARLQFWRRDHWQQQPRQAQLGLFALIWFAVIFGFFTIAVTKLPSYVLPLLPAAAIMVGLLWSDLITRQPPASNAPPTGIIRGVRISSVVNIVFALILVGAILYSPHWMRDDPAMPNVAEIIERSGILIWGAAIWLLVAIAVLVLLLRRQSRWLWLANLVGFCAFLIVSVMPAIAIVDSQRQLPLRELAATVVQVQQPDEDLMMIGFKKPSLVFYTQRSVIYVSSSNNAISRIKKVYRDDRDRSLLVVAYPSKLKEAKLKPSQYEVIEERGAYSLVRVPLPLKS